MIKYVVIDLSKLDGDKLSKMLTEAYENGYNDAKKEQYNRGYESSYTTVASLNGICLGDTMTNCVISSADTAISAIDTSVKSSN